MKLFKKHETLVYFIILIGICALTYRNWFFVDAYYYFGDFATFTRFSESWAHYFGVPYIWTTRSDGMGLYNPSVSSLPISIMLGFFSQYVSSASQLIRYFLLIPTALLAPISSFLLIKSLLKNNLAAFVASLVYAYNVYILTSQIGGVIPITLAYSIAPLALFFYIKYINNRTTLSFIGASLVLTLMTFVEVRIFYIVFWILQFYLVYYLGFVRAELNIKSKIYLLISGQLPFLIVVLMNLYWIFPLFASNALEDVSYYNREIFGNSYFSLRQSLSFFFPWWTEGRGYALGVVQPIPTRFWLIPLVAVIGFMKNSKSKYALFFLLLTVLGVFLTKQVDKPFPNVYEWLYENFPGFNFYREASKFYVISALGYTGLIGYFVLWAEKYGKSKKSIPFLHYFLIAPVTFLFLYNTIPLFDGSAAGVTASNSIHKDYLLTKDFISEQDGTFRSMWAPTNPSWAYFDTDKINLSLYKVWFSNDYSEDDRFQKLRTPLQGSPEINARIFAFFEQDFSGELLDILSVKYVFVPANDFENDEAIIKNYGFPDTKFIESVLDNQDYLTRINIGEEEILVYENSDYLPMITLLDDPDEIQNHSVTDNIFVEKISPVEHRIQINNLSDEKYLFFGQSFSEDWELLIEAPSNYRGIKGEINKIDQEFHESYGILELNIYTLDPEYIKENFPTDMYEENDNGSINLDLTLYFRNQYFVNVGITIGILLTLLTILGYYILWGRLSPIEIEGSRTSS